MSERQEKAVAPAAEIQEQKVETPAPAASPVAAGTLPPVLRTEVREQDGSTMEFRSCPGCGRERKGLAGWFVAKAAQSPEEKGYEEPFLCNKCAKARRKTAAAPVAEKATPQPEAKPAAEPKADQASAKAQPKAEPKAKPEKASPSVSSVETALDKVRAALNNLGNEVEEQKASEGSGDNTAKAVVQAQWLALDGPVARSQDAIKAFEAARDFFLDFEDRVKDLQSQVDKARVLESQVLELSTKVEKLRKKGPVSAEIEQALQEGTAQLRQAKKEQTKLAELRAERPKRIGRLVWAFRTLEENSEALSKLSVKEGLCSEAKERIEDVRTAILRAFQSERSLQVQKAGVRLERKFQRDALAASQPRQPKKSFSEKKKGIMEVISSSPSSSANGAGVSGLRVPFSPAVAKVQPKKEKAPEEQLQAAASGLGVLGMAMAKAGIPIPQKSEGDSAPAEDLSGQAKGEAKAKAEAKTEADASFSPEEAEEIAAAQAAVVSEKKKTRRSKRG